VNTFITLFCLIDSLLASDWARLEEVASLLEPFAVQTDILQSDAQSLSSIIPALLDLECHLQQHTAAQVLTSSLLRDLRQRFKSIMQPTADDFNPLPAAACVLDPSFAPVIMDPEQSSLLHAAKMYVVQQCGSVPAFTAPPTDADNNNTASSPALSRFRFLSSKLNTQERVVTSAAHNPDAAVTQMTRYMTDVGDAGGASAGGLDFWSSRGDTYRTILPLAQDLLAAPASQAYVERVFSLCGLLTAGRRNRMSQSLEMRVFLKLNAHLR